MKNLFIIILLFISLCLLAQNVPQTIDYQGRLADSDGNYLNSVVIVDFLIYDAETGGTLLWNETQDVSCANGVFHVLLGSVTSFPTDLFDNADCWLELIVSNETLSPRTTIASVPYSIKAQTAYTVKVPLSLSGNVASPNSVITSENTGDGYGVYGSNSSGNFGLLGSSNTGVYGYNIALTGAGVQGISTGYYGGYFNTNYNDDATHVVHAEFTGTGNINAKAVYAKSKPQDAKGFGGQFEGGRYGVEANVYPTGSSMYTGVKGNVYGGSGYNFAIDSHAYGLGTNYGVLGFASGGSFNYAGYFAGNVVYTGTLNGVSDERFKENVQPFRNALSKIKLMDVHTFNFIQMEEEKRLILPEGEQIGLIAQELEEIIPELVENIVHAYDKNEGIVCAESDMEQIEYKGINYIGLVPVLIEAVKELQTINEEQQRLIDKLLISMGNK